LKWWPGQIDGIDLLSVHNRDAVLLEYYSKQHWVEPIRAIRTKRWKLCSYETGERELYDLERDPAEAHNIAGTVAAKQQEEKLMARVEKWRQDERR